MYLLIYLILSLGTAIACTLILYTPVYKELKEKSINNIMVSYKKTGYTIIFLGVFIATPIIFPLLFSYSSRETFKLTLLQSFLS